MIDRGLANSSKGLIEIMEFEQIGVLVSEKSGRDMIYKNPMLLEILSE